MSQNRVDGEVPQLRQLQERWLRLPLSYRVNALLYFLGACATIFLVTTLFRGGDDNPRQIQVGAGTVTTATTRSGPTSSAASPVPSTTGGSLTTTTSTRPTSTTAASTGAGGGGGGAGGGGGGGGSNTTAPPATSGTTTPAPTDTTAPTTPSSTAPSNTSTTAPVCRNSTDPSCGQFRWDPAPAGNQPVSIEIAVSPANPRAGQEVTFTVTVHDPDHAIGSCAWLDFGDGTSQGTCQPPPCPARYGPWDPPARAPDTRIFSYPHRYAASGAYIATFFVDNRTSCYDPYGEPVTKHAPLVIDPGT